jgi:hypothetical protein
MPKGDQMTVPTPGKNRKHYLAGTLNARTGAGVWAEYEAKTSELFIRLLDTQMKTYRHARRLILIVDNYIIHESRVAQGWGGAPSENPATGSTGIPSEGQSHRQVVEEAPRCGDAPSPSHDNGEPDPCGDLLHGPVTTVTRRIFLRIRITLSTSADCCFLLTRTSELRTPTKEGNRF